MPIELTAREKYEEAYRAVRTFFPPIGKNGEQRRAHDNLFFDMLDRSYGFTSFHAYMAYTNRTTGIRVNWKLHDRLQDYCRRNAKETRAIKGVTQALSHIQDR